MNNLRTNDELSGFGSFEEISDLKGFVPENPLTLENYKQIVGWYRLREKRSCCVQRGANTLCATPHNRGWVARLQDDSLTILGSDCARTKFGADSSVFKDIRAAENARKAKERELRIVQLVAEGTSYQATLQDAITGLKASYQSINDFLGGIGEVFCDRIEKMAKSGSADVVVEGEIMRQYEHRGRSKQEISVIKHRLGSLAGLSAVSKPQFVALIVEMEQIKSAFAELQGGSLLGRKEKAELSLRLEQSEQVLRRAHLLHQAATRFMKNSVFLYCFLTHDRSERAKLARLAMKEAGIDGNKDYAKAWLADRENEIRLELRADRIRLVR